MGACVWGRGAGIDSTYFGILKINVKDKWNHVFQISIELGRMPIYIVLVIIAVLRYSVNRCRLTGAIKINCENKVNYII